MVETRLTSGGFISNKNCQGNPNSKGYETMVISIIRIPLDGSRQTIRDVKGVVL